MVAAAPGRRNAPRRLPALPAARLVVVEKDSRVALKDSRVALRPAALRPATSQPPACEAAASICTVTALRYFCHTIWPGRTRCHWS